MRDAQHRSIRIVYRWTLVWLAILVVLCVATWAYEIWSAPSGLTMTLPLGPGRQVHANLWKPGPGYTDADFNHRMIITRHGPPNIMLWYQDSSRGTMVRLGTIRLALWPLVLLTTVLAGLVAWLRTRQFPVRQ